MPHRSLFARIGPRSVVRWRWRSGERWHRWIGFAHSRQPLNFINVCLASKLASTWVVSTERCRTSDEDDGDSAFYWQLRPGGKSNCSSCGSSRIRRDLRTTPKMGANMELLTRYTNDAVYDEDEGRQLGNSNRPAFSGVPGYRKCASDGRNSLKKLHPKWL